MECFVGFDLFLPRVSVKWMFGCDFSCVTQKNFSERCTRTLRWPSRGLTVWATGFLILLIPQLLCHRGLFRHFKAIGMFIRLCCAFYIPGPYSNCIALQECFRSYKYLQWGFCQQTKPSTDLYLIQSDGWQRHLEQAVLISHKCSVPVGTC